MSKSASRTHFSLTWLIEEKSKGFRPLFETQGSLVLLETLDNQRTTQSNPTSFWALALCTGQTPNTCAPPPASIRPSVRFPPCMNFVLRRKLLLSSQKHASIQFHQNDCSMFLKSLCKVMNKQSQICNKLCIISLFTVQGFRFLSFCKV